MWRVFAFTAWRLGSCLALVHWDCPEVSCPKCIRLWCSLAARCTGLLIVADEPPTAEIITLSAGARYPRGWMAAWVLAATATYQVSEAGYLVPGDVLAAIGASLIIPCHAEHAPLMERVLAACHGYWQFRSVCEILLTENAALLAQGQLHSGWNECCLILCLGH